MKKYVQLTLEQRICIERMLDEKKSIRKIAGELCVSPSTVSREVSRHARWVRKGCMYTAYNACAKRFTCNKVRICSKCVRTPRPSRCRKCFLCNDRCPDYVEQVCPQLNRPGKVCNGCSNRAASCTLKKKVYSAKYAEEAYRTLQSESRKGISLSEEEIRYHEELLAPGIKKKQSIYHICTIKKDEVTVSERTIYRYIDQGVFSFRNIDLPRKVRYSSRKKVVHAKVDRKCRIGRTIREFETFMEENPECLTTQMDSVEGKKGGKVLLTIHFVKAECMLAFIREHNTSASVIEWLNFIDRTIGREAFCRIFQVIKTDNGTEFSNPGAIERDASGERRTRIFYCDAGASQQKGSAERNHEFIRMFIPKGKDMAPYTQEDISLMMSHINSYCRGSLGGKSPYDMFEFLYGKGILGKLGCHRIAPEDVTLNPSIFKKDREVES